MTDTHTWKNGWRVGRAVGGDPRNALGAVLAGGIMTDAEIIYLADRPRKARPDTAEDAHRRYLSFREALERHNQAAAEREEGEP